MESDPFAEIRGLIAEWDLKHINGTNGDEPSPYIDWATLADEDDEVLWLVENMWPRGRTLVLYAMQKTGKSLVSLHIATSLALGVDPFTGAEREPLIVIYLDYEMTRMDVHERLLDMGHYEHMRTGALDGLRYALHPPTAPMDTAEGGRQVLAMALDEKADVVIIDTVSRVIKGDENSADTFRAFALHTGTPLKANGISVMRLDHEGKSKDQGMRGSSAKGDDPDITYRLSEVDGGYKLIRGVSRVGYVQAEINLTQMDDPLAFKTSQAKWSFLVTSPKRAAELTELGVPFGMSVRATAKWLRDHGHPVGKTTVLSDAVKYRNERGAIDEFLPIVGNTQGNARELE
ncbi:MAG: AAA family ATPase [Chitinophagaceae bacterium]